MKLRANQRCPIHGGFVCPCRPEARAERFQQKRSHRSPRKRICAKWLQVAPGVYRIDDPHHPRGFRERRSPAAMDRLLEKKVKDQDGCCFYCGKQFEDVREVTPDHVEPRGAGGAWRDDHESNIVASCAPCNQAKGSRRLA